MEVVIFDIDGPITLFTGHFRLKISSFFIKNFLPTKISSLPDRPEVSFLDMGLKLCDQNRPIYRPRYCAIRTYEFF